MLTGVQCVCILFLKGLTTDAYKPITLALSNSNLQGAEVLPDMSDVWAQCDSSKHDSHHRCCIVERFDR